MTTPDLKAVFRKLDKGFDLREGFFESLVKEDDWSFTIKLHALLEAAVSHLLTHSQGTPRLQVIFERLPLSDTALGKLAFVSALDLLTKPEQKFIRTLSELRNNLVHRVNNVNFRFPDYLASLDKQQRRSFRNNFTEWAPEQIRDNLLPTIETDPKPIIWLGALVIISGIQGTVATTKAERKRSERLLEIASDLVANQPDLDPDLWDEDG